ncbi:helix-turn-helix domain-containing protein [Bacillus cytotoxicus]|uniref:helix-turn-helix domain-containing protein n=1 Tax=Bacillus cytotoxicus TaxID=580165 RepID=UPI0008644A4A|nr:helix-turn-helix transcriptional regulator [Bacillus cytotoxicus]AWC29287.1 XRE family transcriptional regulator [Bacillus cytotoxicus]AWC41413.1 XRE family transcriptional regulator [Bacillus cytotoxicus]AWC49344.1 XRE family transcriptional regulator [Bacillus cytotoxicus]AWC53359.1 XRE family transcriptional regulator [Bacillus cytotoxicus]AWC57486.1 XRE family transcriptional regulator [Bacillus cytotoxicus]
MGITEIIKQLCQKRGISISKLEEELGFGQNTIYQWKKRTPSVERVQKVADYFNVSTDYLLGRTKNKYWELTEKDEKDIQKKLEELIEDMGNADALAFSKGSEPMSEETKQLLIISLENALRLGKQMAKKKFTPKKYRDE